jgi:uncharacterized protein (DUF1499 family)
MKRTLFIAIGIAVLLLPVLLLALLSILSRRPANLGVHDGELSPCPDSPNCVSSRAQDQEHRIEPLTYSGPPVDAWRRLADVVRNLPRTRVVTQTADYLHVEFTSAVFRFTDDLEFQLDERAGVIHVRSASRTGHSDLGANRGRVERIRQRFGNSGPGNAPAG